MSKEKTQLEIESEAVDELRRLFVRAQAKADKLKPKLPQLFRGTADGIYGLIMDLDGYTTMWIRDTDEEAEAGE